MEGAGDTRAGASTSLRCGDVRWRPSPSSCWVFCEHDFPFSAASLSPLLSPHVGPVWPYSSCSPLRSSVEGHPGQVAAACSCMSFPPATEILSVIKSWATGPLVGPLCPQAIQAADGPSSTLYCTIHLASMVFTTVSVCDSLFMKRYLHFLFPCISLAPGLHSGPEWINRLHSHALSKEFKYLLAFSEDCLEHWP